MSSDGQLLMVAFACGAIVIWAGLLVSIARDDRRKAQERVRELEAENAVLNQEAQKNV